MINHQAMMAGSGGNIIGGTDINLLATERQHHGVMAWQSETVISSKAIGPWRSMKSCSIRLCSISAWRGTGGGVVNGGLGSKIFTSETHH